MASQEILKDIDLVIFDYDGVIYDMIQPLRETVIEYTEKFQLKSHGLNEDMREVFHVLEFALSRSVSDQILEAKEMLDIKLLEDKPFLQRLRIATSLYGSFRAKTEEPALFDGIPSLIMNLKQKSKKKLAILSNSAKHYILQTLDHFHLDHHFNLILGAAEVSEVKPNPEGLFKICEQLNVKPERTLFIGDMISDIQAGANAGIKTAVVASGIIALDKLQAHNPYLLVHDISELNHKFGFNTTNRRNS